MSSQKNYTKLDTYNMAFNDTEDHYYLQMNMFGFHRTYLHILIRAKLTGAVVRNKRLERVRSLNLSI